MLADVVHGLSRPNGLDEPGYALGAFVLAIELQVDITQDAA